MGIREKINQNKWLGLVVGVVLVSAAVGVSVMTGGNSRPDGFVTNFYTNDDGKTFYEDRADIIAPYTKDGREAVKAAVFTCDSGKTKFIGYMERLSPQAKAEAEKYKKAGSMPDTPTAQRIFEGGAQIKHPGEKEWATRDSFGPNGPAVKCPDGKTFAMPVVPGAPAN
jgi:hypothetical protein